MGRFATPQKFWGFTTKDDPSLVDIIGTLRLQTKDGFVLPGIRARMAPGQHDDLLVSATDLDMLGWSRDHHSDYFELLNCAILIARETPIPEGLVGEYDPELLAPRHLVFTVSGLWLRQLL